MAEASIISVEQENFNCSICLKLLEDPVSVSCGHSFCKNCLNGYWDNLGQTKSYSCPQCRETFSIRPVLRRNNILAEIVEKLQQTPEVQPSFATAFQFEGDQDVDCDSCMGEDKKKAVKSCLTCVASFCDVHVQAHCNSAAFKTHTLVEVIGNLQTITCAQHNKILDLFCRKEQRAICYHCSLDLHKGHDIVPIKTEWTEKKQLEINLLTKFQSRIEKREKALQELEKLTGSYQRLTKFVVDYNENELNGLISYIKDRQSELNKKIRDEEKREMDHATELHQKLEQELSDLERKKSKLQKLSESNDFVLYLQSFQFLSVQLEANDNFKVALSEKWSFDDFETSVYHLRKVTESFFKDEFKKLFSDMTFGEIVTKPDPETREEFLKHSCQLSLDPNTVNCYLTLSDENTQVKADGQVKSYPNHPERFTHWSQVLSSRSVPAHFYMEVIVNGENGVSIAMSFKEIKRTGSDNKSRFGHNAVSWRLVCYPKKYTFWHNDNKIDIVAPAAKRIGVYLNQRRGVLAFYGVSNKMTLIHKVTSDFSQPLYAGFGIGSGSEARLCLQVSADTTDAAACPKKK